MANILGVGSISITDVNDALITTDGQPPRDPSEGMLWIDDSGDTSVLKVFHNGEWDTQRLDIANLDPDLKETIETVLDTLGTIADDGRANFNERKRISQEVSSIIGELPSRKAGNVYPNTLPTHTTLDSRGVGSFASARENARNATIGTDESVYIELRQAYDALNSYLSAQTPKLWDITDANKNNVAILSDPDAFREVFLTYYMAELRLATESEKRAKQAMEDYTDGAVSDTALRDKTEILSGTEIYTGKADDSVVHVEIDGKSYQHAGSGKNLFNGYIYSGFIDMGDGKTDTPIPSHSTWTDAVYSDRIYVKPNTRYTLSGFTDADMRVREFDSDGVYTASNSGKEFTTDSTTSFVRILWHKGLSLEEKAGNIQLEEGSTATSYEPPAPTPDYPIAIHSLNDVDIVSSVGKRNLLKDSYSTPMSVANGQHYYRETLDNGLYRYHLREDSTRQNMGTYTNFIEFLAETEIGETYTISFDVFPNTSVYTRVTSGGTYMSTEANKWTRIYHTVTNIQNQQVRLGLDVSNSNAFKWIDVKNFKIEKGSESTPYSIAPEDIDYDTKSDTLYKTNLLLDEPLRSVGDVKDRVYRDSNDGLWKVERNVGEHTFDGAEGWVLEQKFTQDEFIQIHNSGGARNKKITVDSEGASNRFVNIGGAVTSNGNGLTGFRAHTGYNVTRFRISPQQLLGVSYSSTNAVIINGWRDWLSNNNVTITYLLQTPTIETLDQDAQDKLNNLHSFQDSNYLYTILDKSSISSSVADNLKPTLHATFKSKGWYRNFRYESDIKNAKESIDNLGNTIIPALEDGLLNKAEKESIRQAVNIISADKKGVDAHYNAINANSALVGTPKTNLQSAKTAYNTAYNNLTTAITSVLSVPDNTRISQSLIDDVNSRFNSYGESLSTLNTRLEQALDAISGKKVDDAVADAITSVDVEYAKNTNATVAPTTGWNTTPPTWEDGSYIWSRTITNYKNGDTHITNPVNITGAQGASGGTGTAGRSISNIQEQYYLSTSATALAGGTWTNTPPMWENGKFMWTRSIITFTNPSGTHTTDPVSVTGSRGEKGDKGDNAPNVKLSGATQIIKVAENGTVTPSSSFTVVASTVNTTVSTWQYSVNGGTFGSALPTGVTRSGVTVTINPSTSTFTTLSIRATDGTVTDTFTVARATDGAKGTDGSPGSPGNPGADAYTVVLTNESHTFAGGVTNAIVGSTTTDILAYKGTSRVSVAIGTISGMPIGMSSSISNNNTNNARITFSVTTSMTSTSGSVTIPLTIDGQSITKNFSYALVLRGAKGDTGDAGRGITGSEVAYQNHTNGTTAPTGTWSSSVPSPVQGRYLWTRTITSYTDSSNVTTYNVSYYATDGQKGDPGSAGKGISSTSVMYQQTTSGTTTPTGTWTASIPTPIQGRYLWTRTVVSYTDGTSSTSYSTSYHATDGQKGDPGVKGDTGAPGISVTATDIEFYLSTSATALSGGSWVTTAPTWVNGRFMWTRTKTTYSSGSPTYTNPVNVTGAQGATGSTGSAGRSVSALKEQYYLSTSKTTQSGGSWVDTSPTWIPGRYVWTRIHITYTNPSGTATTNPVIDSSWEAIDGVEIGGRNLVVYSGGFNAYTLYNSVPSVRGYSIETTINRTGNLNIAMRSNSFMAIQKPDTTYVISGYFYLNDEPIPADFFVRGFNTNGNMNQRSIEIDEDGYTVIVFETGNSPYSYLFHTELKATTGDILRIDELKVEKGNKATDWTEAPEDTDEKFEAIESNYSAYIEETSKAILSYVGETHLEKSEMEERVRAINTLIEQTSSSWQISFEDTINNLTNSLASEIEEAGEANKFIRMENGNIILGQQGSNTEIVIKQDRISFMDSGVEVAHITHQQMRIDQGIFLRSVQIGAHIIKSLDNSPNITVVEFVGQ